MKHMNMHEEKQYEQSGLKSRVLAAVCERLANAAAEPRCWNHTVYEPELPSEILEDMRTKP